MVRVQRQQGFTLVEIAVVLVIIGLLLGGVLKGQELIASARVRNMADQQAGIQAAYFGFIDRYRAVPGDMPQLDADDAIQATIATGGDGNGKVDDGGTTVWTEPNAVWEHLSKAGFMKGSFNGSDSASTNDTAPINVFNAVLILVRDDGYEGDTNPVRLMLHMGRNVSAEIARELDTKLDDSRPDTGILRNALTTGSPFSPQGESAAGCIGTDAGGDEIWDITTNVQDCHPVYLF